MTDGALPPPEGHNPFKGQPKVERDYVGHLAGKVNIQAAVNKLDDGTQAPMLIFHFYNILNQPFTQIALVMAPQELEQFAAIITAAVEAANREASK